VTNTDINAALDVITETDAYKLGHRRQYPHGTEVVFSNLTARGSRVPDMNHTVFFGLQAFLARLNEKWYAFFELSLDELEILGSRYEDFLRDLLGSRDKVDFEHFRQLHALGHLPLRIKAFREGSLVPLRVPYLTIENTDPRFFWLTNHIESSLSAGMWLPVTSATLAWRARLLLEERAAESGDTTNAAIRQGHDFSYRGMEGSHAAAMSGAGHLVSFRGTDTLPAIRFVQRYYGGGATGELIGTSVNATEHSVMTAEGRNGEFGVYERLLDEYPVGVLSLVSDSYDLWSVLTDFLPRLKDKIMSRYGTLVIRPDSGDPELITCGDTDAPEGTPQRKGVVRLLAETFGTVTNTAGYRLLDPHVGVVYGDGITYERADAITANLIRQGFASTVVTLGFGSFTYQYQTRDTFGMAMKATWVQVNGEGRDIFKDPVTDDGTKKSAKGRLAVRSMMNGEPYLIEHPTTEQESGQLLVPVYENGKILRHQDFSDVRHTLEVASGVWRRRTRNTLKDNVVEGVRQ
jgi:nicotinamide phosphoribosyltransferase